MNKKRRTKKKSSGILYVGILVFAVAFLIALEQTLLNPETSFLDHLETGLQSPGDVQQDLEPTLYGPYDVSYVIDGDTAFINIDGEDTKVRFIGIDTPESVHQDESRNTPEGKIASQWTKEYLTGKRVYLEYDIDREDDYGRTLAYIYLEDKVTMVQDELLKAGMAQTLTIQPNSKYASRFHELQVEARESGAGFWRTGFFE